MTAIWVSPIFKQVAFQESYHGYAIQNFLDVDPHFGTREDLREMVKTAHQHDIYVILDIILNHSGDVFTYDADRYDWQSLGKENFYLIGEITGGRGRAFETVEQTGLNAALGIDDIPDKLEYLVKGFRNPSDYFDLFRNSLLVQKESHV